MDIYIYIYLCIYHGYIIWDTNRVFPGMDWIGSTELGIMAIHSKDSQWRMVLTPQRSSMIFDE